MWPPKPCRQMPASFFMIAWVVAPCFALSRVIAAYFVRTAPSLARRYRRAVKVMLVVIEHRQSYCCECVSVISS